MYIYEVKGYYYDSVSGKYYNNYDGTTYSNEVTGIMAMIIGIIVGIIGFIGCGVNYPIYKKLLAKGKSKYAFEIVELAREISEN